MEQVYVVELTGLKRINNGYFNAWEKELNSEYHRFTTLDQAREYYDNCDLCDVFRSANSNLPVRFLSDKGLCKELGIWSVYDGHWKIDYCLETLDYDELRGDEYVESTYFV